MTFKGLLIVTVFVISTLNSVKCFDKSIGKCCTRDCEIRERKNSTFDCVPHTRRLEMLVESYKVLEDLDNGQCVDSEADKFFVYDVKNSTIVGKKELEEIYFPKCCPLGLVYNSENRGCVQSASATEEFIKERFIKVGLPKCKLITDEKLDKFTDLSTILNQKNAKLGQFCVDKNEQRNFVLRKCQTDLRICKEKRCLRKCCPDGQSYVKDGDESTCQDTYIFGLNIKNHYFGDDIENATASYEVIYNTGCSKYNQLEKNTISYSINRNGSYRYFSNFSNSFFEKEFDHPESYCIEYSYEKNKLALGRYYVFECKREEYNVHQNESNLVVVGIKIMSIVFLILSIPLIFKTLRDNKIFKILITNYCSALMMGMMASSLTHMSQVFQFGYLLAVFSSFASISWLTMLSFDVWKNLRKFEGIQKPVKLPNTTKQIITYSIFGWGLPLGYVFLIFALDLTKVFSDSLRLFVGPNILDCGILNRNYARLVFFLLPELAVQILNMVFIFSTLACLIKMNNINTKKLSAISQNKWLMIIVKMTVLTSFSFMLDVVLSSFDMRCRQTQNDNVEMVLESIISLQGVFTFVLLFCRKGILLLCKNKFKNTELSSVETVTSDMSLPTSPLSESDRKSTVS